MSSEFGLGRCKFWIIKSEISYFAHPSSKRAYCSCGYYVVQWENLFNKITLVLNSIISICLVFSSLHFTFSELIQYHSTLIRSNWEHELAIYLGGVMWRGQCPAKLGIVNVKCLPSEPACMLPGGATLVFFFPKLGLKSYANQGSGPEELPTL